MDHFAPETERRIRRLRWTAALIWVAWLAVALPLYWLYKFTPHLISSPTLIAVAILALGIGAVWFTYCIYRIGELADGNG